MSWWSTLLGHSVCLIVYTVWLLSCQRVYVASVSMYVVRLVCCHSTTLTVQSPWCLGRLSRTSVVALLWLVVCSVP